jgi:hypothetical protein
MMKLIDALASKVIPLTHSDLYFNLYRNHKTSTRSPCQKKFGFDDELVVSSGVVSIVLLGDISKVWTSIILGCPHPTFGQPSLVCICL